MAGRLNAGVELLTAVPTEVRRRIISGMRWTLWLSLLAVPFSYGTSILLARVGPETIGTYGLLMVYLSLVNCFLYLGGDAVLMKFLPELEADKRTSFLASYFLVVCLSLLPWLLVAVLWSEKLRIFFGPGGAPFHVLIVCLSPVYMLFLMVAAALKAMLEIRWAQGMVRFLTVSLFFLFGCCSLGARQILVGHAPELIWGTYLALAALAAVLGLQRLRRLPGWQPGGNSPGFYLPPGFWRYALSLQGVSIVLFFINQLDSILILNAGGLAVLGKYVAVLTLAMTIRVANNFFLDTLLPSLTNLIADRKHSAASQVLSMNLRILFLINTAATCGLMLLAGAITALLGSQFSSSRPLIILTVLLVGLSSPGAVGGTLLTCVGKQGRAFWIDLGQLGLYVVLFFSLWSRWRLLGAVLAFGIAVLLGHTALLTVAKRSVPLDFHFTRDYLKFALVTLATAVLSMGWTSLGIAAALPAWALATGIFLWLAEYRLEECMGLIGCFAPACLPRSAQDRRSDLNLLSDTMVPEMRLANEE